MPRRAVLLEKARRRGDAQRTRDKRRWSRAFNTRDDVISWFNVNLLVSIIAIAYRAPAFDDDALTRILTRAHLRV